MDHSRDFGKKIDNKYLDQGSRIGSSNQEQNRADDKEPMMNGKTSDASIFHFVTLIGGSVLGGLYDFYDFYGFYGFYKSSWQR